MKKKNSFPSMFPNYWIQDKLVKSTKPPHSTWVSPLIIHRNKGIDKFFVDALSSSITSWTTYKSNDIFERLLHQHFLRRLLCGTSAPLNDTTDIMRFELIGEGKWLEGGTFTSTSRFILKRPFSRWPSVNYVMEANRRRDESKD